MGNTNTKCVVCNTDADGVKTSPGCCENWMHHDCLIQRLNDNNVVCASCNRRYPQNILNMATNTATTATAVAAPVTAVPVTAAPAPAPAPPQTVQCQNFIPPPPPPHTSRCRDGTARYLSNAEEPVEPWVAPNANVIVNAHGNTNAETGIFCVESVPELPQISLEAKNAFYTVVSISVDNVELSTSTAPSNIAAETADESTGAKTVSGERKAAPVEMEKQLEVNIENNIVDDRKPPMDVVLVLDTSGSMRSQQKLTNVKHAVNFVRDELNCRDRMGVIEFDTSASVVHNLLCLTPENKRLTQGATDALHPRGGTQILQGLIAARDMLNNRATKNPVSSVFLLTDGIDNSDIKLKKKVAKEIRDLGASLFVFGFGNDHDSKHLKMIADAADGMFTFIEESDMVIDAFGGALGAEKSVFATDLCVSMEALNSITLTAADTGNYKKNLAANGKTLQVYFNNLMLGEERDILLTLSIPECSAPVSSFQLMDTKVSYLPLGSAVESKVTVNGDACLISRVDASDIDPSTTRNEEVDVQVNRALLAKATEESIAAADKEEYKQARAKLEATREFINNSTSCKSGNKKSLAFRSEINSTIDSVSDSYNYRTKGGRSMMTEVTQTMSAQRCLYTKEGRSQDLYQNASSEAFQVRSKTKKAAIFRGSTTK